MIVGAYPRGTRSSQKITAGVGTVFADAKWVGTKKTGTQAHRARGPKRAY
jgi:hypothetical protein